MAITDTDVELEFSGVAQGVPVVVGIQTSGVASEISVRYSTAKIDAVQGVDYTLTFPVDLSTFSATPTLSLMNKITATGLGNVIYVKRTLPYTSDFDFDNAFVREKLVDEFDRTWMAFQQIDYSLGDMIDANDAAAAAAEASAAEAAASADAADISEANAAASAALALSAHEFNVKSYGAVGDGVTDDTAALQACGAAASAVPHGTIYLPRGKYFITGTAFTFTGAYLPNIVGEGKGGGLFPSASGGESSSIVLDWHVADTVDVIIVALTSDFYNGVIWRDFGIITQNFSLNPGRYGIRFDQSVNAKLVNDIIFERIYVRGVGSNAMGCSFVSFASVGTNGGLANCAFRDCFFENMYFSYVGDNMLIDHCSISTLRSMRVCLKFNNVGGAASFRVVNCNIGGMLGEISCDGAISPLFQGNEFETPVAGHTGPNGAMIDLAGGISAVSQPVIIANGFSSNTGTDNAIRVHNADRAMIAFNRFQTNASTVKAISLTSSAVNTYISDANRYAEAGVEVKTSFADASATTQVIRRKLGATLSLFVRPTGNDANNGEANTAAGAFLTIQAAINYIQKYIDLNGFGATIFVAAGTYTAGVTVFGPFVGLGNNNNVTLAGDTTTPANVTISTTSASCINCNAGGRILVQGFKLTTATSGYGLTASDPGSRITITGKMEFGACASGQIFALVEGVISIIADYIISASSPLHWVTQQKGFIQCAGRTVTLTGTPAFSTAFAQASDQGLITCNANTYTGSATGKSYNVPASGGGINAGGGSASMPGSVAGTVASPGYVT